MALFTMSGCTSQAKRAAKLAQQELAQQELLLAVRDATPGITPDNLFDTFSGMHEADQEKKVKKKQKTEKKRKKRKVIIQLGARVSSNRRAITIRTHVG